MKRLLPSVLLLALACPGGTALAQDGAAAASARPAPRFFGQPEPGTLRSSKILGVGVIGMDHVKVGTIEDVLLDAGGRVEAVVIGVGGFLGIGEKYVAVPFDQLAWNVGDVPLTGGTSSVVTERNAPPPAEAAKAGPETMPGGQVDREALGAVQNRHSGRVTAETGSVKPQQPDGERATVLAGDAPVHAEIRLTKAQIGEAPAFRFDAQAKRAGE